ncbi:PAAR domain-containing protein [Caballeronia sp. GAWG1-5s-s]|uniref:PAAR domain-containing protein n=1 Tax=Caballeronia sp. GAWG1-5s-s TaxID=2921743 RepID=UPI002028638B|nr:PAAR domain-containing protein [Caballeronia sp. GAWG1-5s-s]
MKGLVVTKSPIRYGDTTDHGGSVISASTTLVIGGRACALRGDRVRCPEHGIVQIVEGDEGYTENGHPIAVHGCRTACGARLLASTDELGV